jgi:hypothetical protein
MKKGNDHVSQEIYRNLLTEHCTSHRIKKESSRKFHLKFKGQTALDSRISHESSRYQGAHLRGKSSVLF